jgi:hypothetical protein
MRMGEMEKEANENKIMNIQKNISYQQKKYYTLAERRSTILKRTAPNSVLGAAPPFDPRDMPSGGHYRCSQYSERALSR